MIKFKQVEARNFRAFESMKIDLDNQGLVMVLGNNKDTVGKSSNGASKSSIFYAVLWALYGQLPESSSSNSIINEKVGKNTGVFLDFSVNNQKARVERYRKDKENKNKVLFFINDKEVTKPSNKATDKEIEDFLGISMATMLNSIMFGSSRVVDFVSATDKQRKEILEELSNVSIYREAQDRVKQARKDANFKLSESKTKLEGITSQKSYLNALEASYEAQRAEHEDRLKNLQNKISSFTSIPDVTPLKEQKDKLSTTLKRITDEGSKIQYQDTTSLSNQLSTLKNSILNERSKFNDYINLIKTDKDEFIKIKNSKDAYCKLCGNKLDAEHKKTELARLAEEAKDAKAKAEELKSSISTKAQEYKKLNPELEKIQEENAKLKVVQDKYRSQYKEVLEKINSIQSNIDSINNKANQLLEAKEQLESEKKKVVAKPKELEENKSLDSKDLEKQVDKLTKEVQDYDDLVKIFGDKGVKAHVLSLAIPFINKKMEEYMNILSHGSLNAYITREKNADGSLTERLGVAVDSLISATNYDDLSSGEKKRVAISLNVAFLSYLASKIGGINISVFDEIFDSLDESGTDAVIELLKSLSNQVGSIFVISHNDDLKYNDNFDKVITVEKENGLSKVV